jgi:ABC-type sugar transport system substrate-binding protein
MKRNCIANGKATIIELQGTTGSSPANDRRTGFAEGIKEHPEMKIVASQTGDFARDKGRQVAETLLQAALPGAIAPQTPPR